MQAFVTSCGLRLGALVLVALLAVCATAYSRGAEALHAGRFADAARELVSESSRRLVAASLDDAVEWARDVREASERATVYPVELSWTSYRDLYYPRLP